MSWGLIGRSLAVALVLVAGASGQGDGTSPTGTTGRSIRPTASLLSTDPDLTRNITPLGQRISLSSASSSSELAGYASHAVSDLHCTESLVCPGDLDGDGKDDLATVGGAFVARKGSDGSVLSSIPLPRYPWLGTWTLGDLTGDGLAELVVLQTEETSLIDTGDDDLPVVGGQVEEQVKISRLRHTVTAWSIADRQHLWDVSFEGSTRRAAVWTPPHAREPAAMAHETNMVNGLFISPDVSGDGRQDVFLHLREIDRSLSVAHAEDEREHVSRYERTDRGVSLEGVSGAEVGRITRSAIDSEIQMVPVADMSGDGRGEIVVLAGSDQPDSTVILSVHRAEGGEPRWRVETGSVWRDWRAAIRSVPLRSGATADLLFSSQPPGASGRHSWLAYSGSDGTILWEHMLGWATEPLDAIGDVSGDGGHDFLVVLNGDPYEAYAFSGSDGSILWSRTVTSPPNREWQASSLGCSGDFNADQVCDFIEIVRKGHVDERGSFVVEEFERLAVSGRDGGALWREEGVGDVDRGSQVLSGKGDVTGDGADDLYERTISTDESGTLVEFAFSDGASRAPLWRVSSHLGADEDNPGISGVDLLGDASAEVVLEIHGDDESPDGFRYRVYAASTLVYELVIPSS